MNEICGSVQEIMYDPKIDKLNLELVIANGIPLIVFEDWTEDETRNLFRLHIKEAIELKSVIDQLVVDYLEEKANKADDT